MPRNTSTAARKEKVERKDSQHTPLRPPVSPTHQPQKTPPLLQASRVAGTRMSGVKHSGLLAKDEDLRRTTLDVSDTISNIKLDLTPTFEAANTGGSSDVYPLIAGRDIYAFQGHSKQKKRKGIGGGESSNVISTPQLGKRKRERAPKVATAVEDAASKSSSGEEMEDTTQQRRRKDDTASKVPSDSDFSDDLSNEDDMVSIAARLNRGEAMEQTGGGMLEDYFTAHSEKTSMTSDHTLSKLARPRMDQESVQSALKATPSVFQADYQLLYNEYRKLYPYWLFQMSEGYNILLYGLGSKRKLIEDFRNKHLSNACHLVVNGYFPGLTVKHVLAKLTGDLLEHSGTFKSHVDQAQFVCRTLDEQATDSDLPKEVFLVVHNIDGSTLRGDKVQTALSILAQSLHIHVIASIDHINAPLIWDQKKLSRFNWLWHDVTTYEPYQEETSYENSLLLRQSGTLVLSTLKHVMKSLTPNARGVFELLARYQLEHKEGETEGMSFHTCYLKCREKFLVNSDLTLRAQLTEFRDHKLVLSRKGSDGVEYLHIPIDDSALSQFLEQQSEK